MKKLKGQLAIITGGARGIGEGVCEVFCREGAKLMTSSSNGRIVNFATDYFASQQLSWIIIQHSISPFYRCISLEVKSLVASIHA